ncbi:hypothetical protein CEUSTIGMA_g11415.t1 [Chlamydomonas eustigma]|uniref:Uncharacterized protein n=1 Tax=Chlamydomonas eustigma TaxID=1157962 RepID=A0A250XMH7_9CHLO|nr:hypothetical protein CEUSTIGMA_g11415.t1 [Chlamydomonas eustigma]|eukprot:GAX83990.1 hypothetical protein CEUSTIGMA_g11415.t1 [Chlamydomonas eustigma]
MDPHAELVQLLLDGARYGDDEDVESAIRQHVGVDSTDEAGRTALHMACANGHESVACYLINAGADVDIKNKEGNTPLHWACLNGHKSIVKTLLEKQAIISVLNNAGKTPVDEALTRDDKELMEIIHEASKGMGDDISVEVEEMQDDEVEETLGDADTLTAVEDTEETAVMGDCS